jgi:hypothetical protein
MAPPKRKGGRTLPATKPNSATSSGRVTHRSGSAKAAAEAEAFHHASAPSSRYTPPTPKYMKVSPRWVPILMGVLLVVGALMIVLNYLSVLPGATSNWYLLAGLAMILGGIITATQWH